MNTMKSLILCICIALAGTTLKSQNSCLPPTYSFTSMTNVSGNGGVGSIYRFTNSISGVNTFVIISKLQNATITNSNMDITGSYALAWQPTIRFTNNRNSGDSSYVEFTFRFVDAGTGPNLNSIDNTPSKQGCMAMTIVDCDGPGNSNTYREMVKVSLPATPIGILNSTINVTQDSRWINLISGPSQFSNIDTSDYPAMAQINFPKDTKGFTVRVGAVGAVTANLDRQFSFYFKSFTGLNFVLPVTLINFNTHFNNHKLVELNWSTASEEYSDRFDIYRSDNGLDFFPIGSVPAAGNSSDVRNYQFIDNQMPGLNQSQAFYKLKMIESSGTYHWSNISKVNTNMTAGGISTIALYPNPASRNIQLDLSSLPSSDLTFEIFDIYGKLVQSSIGNTDEDSPSMTLDISNLMNGMYFISVKDLSGTEAHTLKFIKE